MLRTVIVLTLLFSGCTWLTMPYQDEPLCKKGTASGYCNSISEVDRKVDSIVKDQSVSVTTKYKLKHVKDAPCEDCMREE